MAKLKNNSMQEQNITIQSGVLTEIDFNPIGEFPNVIQIFNYSLNTISIGLTPAVTASSGYEFQIAAGAINVFQSVSPLPRIFAFSTGGAAIKVRAYSADGVDSNNLIQTQNTVIINSTVSSAVNIQNSIPAGTNHIGGVNVDNTVGVNVNNTPSVTVNNIPHVIVDNEPANSIPDGNDIALGARADAAVINPASTASLIALIKGILTADNLLAPSATYSLTSVSAVAADTEYSFTLPAGCKQFQISVQNKGTAGAMWRMSNMSGKVATSQQAFLGLSHADVYMVSGLNIPATLTLYLATSAPCVFSVERWW